MIRQRAILEILGVSLAVFFLAVWGGLSLKNSFQSQNQESLKRLQQSAAAMIAEAHHRKDDLDIQQVVAGLGKASGVWMACVVGNDGTILAHNEPARLGRSFQKSGLPIVARPLYEGPEKWGTLILSVSDRSVTRAWRTQLILYILAGALFVSLWMARYFIWSRQILERDRRVSDLSVELSEQQRNLARETEKQAKLQARWVTWIQASVNRVPEASMLLDDRQRVIAANSRVAHVLGVNGVSLAGKSWQEIPLLSSCGQALERSLASPGSPVEWSTNSGDLRLRFETDPASGTWVTLYSTKH